MSRWFRMYGEVLDDLKVQRLSGDDFKAWVNLLCLASRNDGKLPSGDDIAFALRMDSRKCATLISRLVAATLLDETDGRFEPHGWDARQYKSDVSTDRVKRFRSGKSAVARNSDETFHGTAPETEADTEQSVPVSNETGAADPDKVFWDSAKRYLGPTKASMIGKWVKQHGKPATIAAITSAQSERAVDPVQFIQGHFRKRVHDPTGLVLGPC